MNSYVSTKIKIISFFLMVLVVFLHAHNYAIKVGSKLLSTGKGYNWFIQDLISEGITRIAVPFFFLISGYLFFYNFEPTISHVLYKYKKRIWSLAVPYIFWSLWGMFVYLTLQTIPFSKAFFTKELVKDYTFNKFLFTVFINPIPYQLWFVRDLIILILLSPLVFYVIKYFRYIPLIVFLFFWIVNFDLVIFYNGSLFFFTFGAFISYYYKDIVNKKFKPSSFMYTFIWLMIVILKTVFSYSDIENTSRIIPLVEKAGILMGIVSIWSIFDISFHAFDFSSAKFMDIISTSFFLYAFHEPLLTIFKKGFIHFLGGSEFALIISYFAVPLITITFSVLIAKYLKKYVLPFYLFITGGR